MSRLATPSNVNIKNPLALEKVARAVETGLGRNLSEAAENLILRGAESVFTKEGVPSPEPIVSPAGEASTKGKTNRASSTASAA